MLPQLLLAIFVFAVPCAGYCETLPPEKTISSLFTDLKNIQKSNKEDELYFLLESRLDNVFHKERLARYSLGSNWTKASSKQRTDFVSVFYKLIFYSYVGKLDKLEGSEIVDIRSTEKGRKAVVMTRVSHEGEVYSIDYRLYLLENNWLIYDIIIENVSISTNYRSEFGSIIRKRGLDNLLELLRKKVSNLCKKYRRTGC